MKACSCSCVCVGRGRGGKVWSLCGRWYFGTVRMVCKDKPHATNSFGTYYICSMRIQSFRIQKSVQWNSDASRVKYVTGADLCKHCFLSHCKFNGSAHKKCRKILMYFLCAWERTSFWTTRFPTLALVSRVLCRNRNMYNKNKKNTTTDKFLHSADCSRCRCGRAYLCP